MPDASYATDYNDLVTDIPLTIFGQNAKLIENMPRVINRAEQRVIRRMDHEAFRGNPSILTLLAGDPAVPLPDNLLEIRAVQVQLKGRGWTSLRRRSQEMLDTLYAAQPPGRVLFYAQDAENLIAYPIPAVDTDLRVLGNYRPTPLSDAQGETTNILTDRFPLVIRSSAALEAAIFMGDARLQEVYQADLNEHLQAANMAIARQRRDETATRPLESVNSKG